MAIERSVVSGIIVTHGRLGAELLSAAQAIVGEQSGVYVFSSGELAPTILAQQIEETLKRAGSGDRAGPIILFVDLWGGSSFNVCHRIMKARENVFLFSGVNLPMLLEFLQYRDEVELPQLLERIESRGKRGVRALRQSETP